MAGSENDGGSDAVALAVRDLTEEVRRLRFAVSCGMVLRYLSDETLSSDSHTEGFLSLLEGYALRP